ncbi:MAG: diguanylate cyclase [Comamonas sp.]
MNQPAITYFALIAPTCVALFGLALLTCWYVQRRQPQAVFLLWLSGSFMSLATALALQSLMSNAQLGQFALATACLYLMGCWSLAQGMSLRLRGKGVSVSSGLLIASVTLAVLFYYSQFENDLLLRIQSLAFAMALMQALALPAFVQLKPAQDWVESLVRWTYGFSVGYSLFRPLAVSLLPVNELQELTRSGYWAFSQVVALVFAMLFTVGLLACSVRDMVTNLRDERNRDPLTRLLNRRAFMEAGESLLADRRLAPWALVAVDIDHFKRINDNWGHAAGDQVLVQLGQLLPLQVRDKDLVARFGGEEFILLLNRVQMSEAHAIVDRLRVQMSAHAFDHLPERIRMTASFGIVPVRSAEELAEALCQADALLYAAKGAGRDCVQAAMTTAKPVDDERAAIESVANTALSA